MVLRFPRIRIISQFFFVTFGFLMVPGALFSLKLKTSDSGPANLRLSTCAFIREQHVCQIFEPTPSATMEHYNADTSFSQLVGEEEPDPSGPVSTISSPGYKVLKPSCTQKNHKDIAKPIKTVSFANKCINFSYLNRLDGTPSQEIFHFFIASVE